MRPRDSRALSGVGSERQACYARTSAASVTTHDAVLFAGEGMQLLPPGLHSHVHGHEDTFPTFLDLRQLALLDIF